MGSLFTNISLDREHSMVFIDLFKTRSSLVEHVSVPQTILSMYTHLIQSFHNLFVQDTKWD